MSYYGPLETWKVVYYPNDMTGGKMGVALVEADCRQQAMYTFQQQYAGQYRTVSTCEKLLKS
jgi:hypothetical protein